MSTSRRGRRQTVQPLPRGARPHTVFVLLAVLVVCATFDVFRIGFFADDFHFLDVARRIPLGDLLLGQHGVYPWYRPLSRELFFRLIVAAGPHSLLVAHALGVACVLGCAWGLLRLTEALVGPRTAAVAPVLFVTYAFTKFLAAWASGFHDLLCALLVVWAVLDHVNGRQGRSLAWAGLAPFAKETGFVVLPILVAHAFVVRGERSVRPWMGRQIAVFLAALAVHVAVRMTWTAGGTAGGVARSPAELVWGVGQAVSGFLNLAPAPAAGMPAVIVIAVLAAWLVLGRNMQAGPVPAAAVPASRIGLFLLIASAIGLAPMVGGHLLAATKANPYYGFAAAPFLSMGGAWLAGRVPSGLARVVATFIVALNVWSLGYRAPDLDDREAWVRGRWDWGEAIRLSAVSRRLGDDVRRTLASHPESLVVLYSGLPLATYFQSEDGPATREVLRDITARAYYANDPPMRVPGTRLAILSFGSDRFHLELEPRDVGNAVEHATTSLMMGRARGAFAWASYCPPAACGSFELAYVRSTAALIEEGVNGFRRQLVEEGLADSLGELPPIVGFLERDDPGMAAALSGVIRRPLTAATHVAAAESLRVRGNPVSAGEELRVACTLDPGLLAERLQLGLLLRDIHEPAAARIEIGRVLASAPSPDLAEAAAEALSQVARDRGGVPPP